MTLTDDLKATADALAGGWTIDRLNRARRARGERPIESDVLDRLTTAYNVIASICFEPDDGDDGRDVLLEIATNKRTAIELHGVLADLATLLDDASNAIVRLCASRAL